MVRYFAVLDGKPGAFGVSFPDCPGCVAMGIESGRPVKANISLDQGLLDAIDVAGKRAGLTRSAFLASAAREKIAASS